MAALRDGYHYIPVDPPPFAPFYDWLSERIPDHGSFVEVGVWFGHSFLYLAERLHALGKSVTMHAVDTFRGDGSANQQALVDSYGGSIIGAFRENLERLRADLDESTGRLGEYWLPHTYHVHERDSVEVALAAWSFGEADAIFLDGAHDMRSVLADIAAWRQHLAVRGILCGDDYDQESVRRAVDYYADEYEVEVETMGRAWCIL